MEASNVQPAFCGWRVAAAVGVSGVRNASTTEHIISSHVPDITLPTGNAATYALETAKQWSTNTALECAETGRNYTFTQVVDAVARWGGYLAKLGLGRGDRVAVMMLNCPEYALVLLGAMSAGIPVTVINYSYTLEEVCRQLRDSDASLVVYDDSTEKIIEGALPILQKPVRKIINTDTSPPAGVPSLRSLLQDSGTPLADPVEVTGTETALLPYSSGTTGNPKGVDLSHNALSSNMAMFMHPSFFSGKVVAESHQDSFLCYLPLFHIYGILPILLVGLRAGNKIVTVPRFHATTLIPLVMKHKVRVLHTVPPVLNFLTQSPDVNPKSMASVEATLCGAAPVSQASAQTLKEKVDKPLFFQEGYGMTEVLLSHLTPFGSNRLGSCGKLLPNVKVKVIDRDTGKSLPANEKGEICFMSPSRMNGYSSNEAATRETIDEEGWVHSGDIGYYDDDNCFTVVDRCKELIKVKALQVAPSELEEVILQHPKVKEVGVVGVQHDRLGEAPRAYVVASASTNEKEIQEFLALRVAPHKQLAGGVAFITELPKNASGKILRRQLKDL